MKHALAVVPPDGADLDAWIETLLKDERYRGHPLREALALLWSLNSEQVERLERIAHISDGYQSMALEQSLSLSRRYDKQLRKLEKAARISDRYQRMMRDLNLALEQASTHDQLTGLANRRLLIERLKEETKRAERGGEAGRLLPGYMLAMVDVDHFKVVNDLYGHEAGDRTLVQIARALEGGLREYDLCGRWGGEEFLIILPQTGPDGAIRVLDRIRDNVCRLVIPLHEQGIRVTVSIGLAAHRPGEDFSDTINRADGALHQAKQAGRDCYRLA